MKQRDKLQEFMEPAKQSPSVLLAQTVAMALARNGFFLGEGRCLEVAGPVSFALDARDLKSAQGYQSVEEREKELDHQVLRRFTAATGGGRYVFNRW